jgi:hypothetical protein
VGCHGGPDVSPDGLVFSLDVANRKCISPLGCTGFNNAPQLVKNLVSTSDTINSYNGVKLGNLSYYTSFAIDYPEGSYGGDAANRQGITPGYNVRSGTKTYDASRALHLWVWINSTSSWVPDNYFTGLRLAGHCYDSYVGTAEVDKWVNDYNNIRNTFGNDITVIAMGSHRDSYHTTAQYAILRDLGAPSNVDSIIGFSSPEWILIGKPGLGAGNAYGWVFQNYSTNPDQVAHLNFGLPIYGGTNNYLEFDGVDDYVTVGSLGSQFTNFTVEIWFKSDSVTNYRNPIDCNWLIENGSYSNLGPRLEQNSAGNLSWVVGSGSDVYSFVTLVPSGLSSIPYHHAVITKTSSTNFNGYYNGNYTSSLSFSGWAGSMLNVNIGRGFSPSGERWFIGKIPSVKIYNRALTAAEIQQNFNAKKSRFGL